MQRVRPARGGGQRGAALHGPTRPVQEGEDRKGGGGRVLRGGAHGEGQGVYLGQEQRGAARPGGLPGQERPGDRFGGRPGESYRCRRRRGIGLRRRAHQVGPDLVLGLEREGSARPRRHGRVLQRSKGGQGRVAARRQVLQAGGRIDPLPRPQPDGRSVHVGWQRTGSAWSGRPRGQGPAHGHHAQILQVEGGRRSGGGGALRRTDREGRGVHLREQPLRFAGARRQGWRGGGGLLAQTCGRCKGGSGPSRGAGHRSRRQVGQGFRVGLQRQGAARPRGPRTEGNADPAAGFQEKPAGPLCHRGGPRPGSQRGRGPPCLGQERGRRARAGVLLDR